MLRSALIRMAIRAHNLRSPMVALTSNGSSMVPAALLKLSVGSISPVQMTRNFSEGQTVKEPYVKIPIPMYGVTGNYASSLYVAAVRANLLERVESELQALLEAVKNCPPFQSFMKDLTVPSKVRVKAVQEIFEEAGFSYITKNFLAIVAENGRLRYLEGIAKAFEELTMAHRGEVKALVTTVIPLPAEEEKQLKEVLAEILGPGKTVRLEQKIDTSILGGLVIELGDKLFDISIRTRIKQMERVLNEPIDLDNLDFA